MAHITGVGHGVPRSPVYCLHETPLFNFGDSFEIVRVIHGSGAKEIPDPAFEKQNLPAWACRSEVGEPSFAGQLINPHLRHAEHVRNVFDGHWIFVHCIFLLPVLRSAYIDEDSLTSFNITIHRIT